MSEDSAIHAADTDDRWSTVRLLDQAELGALSAGTIARSPATDYRERYDPSSIHEAESFHCNSRISQHLSANKPLDQREIDRVCEWMEEMNYNPRSQAVDAALSEQMQVEIRSTVGIVGKILTILSELETYAVDVFVLLGGAVYKYRKRCLWLERRIGRPAALHLRSLLCLETGYPKDEPLCTLFFAGVPWRYMAFQGPRGYRRLFIELGRVMADVGRLMAAAGVRHVTSFDFLDVPVERTLGFDGVEVTLLATTLVVGERSSNDEIETSGSEE